MKIPNELSERFDTQEGRKRLVELYADSQTMFTGIDADGETVHLSITHNGMTLRTQQENGWVRVNYYDADGCATGESFDGKWK